LSGLVRSSIDVGDRSWLFQSSDANSQVDNGSNINEIVGSSAIKESFFFGRLFSGL
jgi:hypothetical protein